MIIWNFSTPDAPAPPDNQPLTQEDSDTDFSGDEQNVNDDDSSSSAFSD